jgi:DNA-binding NarL/FixJ family response regulator
MNIVIVEDHTMFREVLVKVCRELSLEVIGETGDGRQGLGMVAALRPNLLLLDLQLPSLDGFAVIEGTRYAAPDTRILVLSSHCDDATVWRLEQPNVQGFLDKNTNAVAALKIAIGIVASGGTSFSAAFERIREARAADPHSFDKLLSNREREIVTLLAIPLCDDGIAARLKISRQTVEKHRLTILRKLRLESTIQLVRYARDHGFTPLIP